MLLRVAIASVLTLLLIPSCCFAEVVDFDLVIKQAVERSYELKIASVDKKISKASITIVRSELFPTIKGSANSEYLKSFDDKPTPVSVVGGNVIPSGTRFQNSAGVNLNQTLFDFGLRKRKVTIARKDVLLKDVAIQQLHRDLQLKLLDTYTEALLKYKTLRNKELLLPIYQQTYQMKERLHKARAVSKVEVAEEAIQVANTLDELNTAKHELQQQLNTLTYYTQESYDIATLDMLDIEDELDAETLAFDETQSTEHQQYLLEKDKKQQEIELLKRQYLPQLSLYSYYNLYGSNQNQWGKAVSDMQSRNVTVGLALQIPIFDGFKTKGEIQKARLEMEKIALERDKKIAELKYKHNNAQQDAKESLETIDSKQAIFKEVNDKFTMMDRLSEKQLLDKTVALKEAASTIIKSLDLDRAKVQRAASLKKLKILIEG